MELNELNKEIELMRGSHLYNRQTPVSYHQNGHQKTKYLRCLDPRPSFEQNLLSSLTKERLMELRYWYVLDREVVSA